jgi:hypothetical protein
MGDYTKLAPASQHTLRGNATARAARACPSPLKILKNTQICAKKAVLLQVVFSSFFVITFFGTIGGVDTQQVTRPN